MSITEDNETKLANLILSIDDDATDEMLTMKKQLDYILWHIINKYTSGIHINYDKLFNYDREYIDNRVSYIKYRAEVYGIRGTY